jgi:hypothetical protein
MSYAVLFEGGGAGGEVYWVWMQKIIGSKDITIAVLR